MYLHMHIFEDQDFLTLKIWLVIHTKKRSLEASLKSRSPKLSLKNAQNSQRTPCGVEPCTPLWNLPAISHTLTKLIFNLFKIHEWWSNLGVHAISFIRNVAKFWLVSKFFRSLKLFLSLGKNLPSRSLFQFFNIGFFGGKIFNVSK